MRRPATAVFHAFTVAHTGIANRILTKVSVSPAFDPNALPDPPPPQIECMALWDTGATASVIAAGTARALDLVPTGLINTRHAGGTGQSNTYIVNIMLPNNVRVAGVKVSELPDDAADFGAIIGMDIITSGDFSITNVNGVTVLSFRTPSIAKIDYVHDANRVTYAGVGRNDSCPCGKLNPDGTRVKYKNCHLKLMS